jgi:hypothetical protein
MKALVIVLLLVVVGGEAGASIREERQEQVRNLPNGYRALGEACLKKGSFNCCISSVRTMSLGNYEPAVLNDGVYECPQGYVKNMQRCIDTYQWCEPEQKESK